MAATANVASAVPAVGVRTHTAPLNIAPSAPSSPSSSLPAIGWPPTKRGSSMASMTVPLTPPTSVTTPSVSDERPLDLVGDGEHGDGDERQLGARVEPGGVDDPAGEGLVAGPATASSPVTCQPASRSASAIEPPMSPRPMTLARGA